MPTQTQIQKEITVRIIEALIIGVVPWRKPWSSDKNSGSPANVISKRRFSGCNPLLLDAVALKQGYRSRWWATYPQWESLGAQVRKRPDDVPSGKWGTQILFWKPISKTEVDDQGNEKTETFPLLRYYTVFNLDQVEGKSVDHLRASSEHIDYPSDVNFEHARKVIDSTGADIRTGGDKAFYAVPIGWPNHTAGDFICVPRKEQFHTPQEFYATCFHELMHWAEARVGWKGEYAEAELVAEMGSCFLCAQTGIPCSDDLSNHAAYLQSWLKIMEQNHKAIFRAARDASKASDLILSFSEPSLESQPSELQTA